MNTNSKITEFIKIVCENLNINIPMVEYKQTLGSQTMLAQCSSDGEKIVIKNMLANFDLFFAIAHELRHVWQIRTDKEFYLSDYKTVEHFPNVQKYNMQIAEIDVNAYAGIVMADVFGVFPQWQGLNQKVINAIKERQETILQN